LLVVVGCCQWGDAMAKKVNKERIVSYRLTEEQYAPFGEIIEKAGISQSQFFGI